MSPKIISALCAVSVVAVASAAMAGPALRTAPAVVDTSKFVANDAKNSPNAPVSIFTNLTKDPLALYDAISGGYYVSGPNAADTGQQWIAIPFTTKAAAVHAKSLSAALGYISGTKQVRLSIFTDAGGVPGTRLGGGSTTNIPDLGVCCGLATVNVPGAGIALSGATKFWLVADNTPGALDMESAWQASLVNDTIAGNVANGGWFAFSGLIPAAKVTGTNP